jgi:hypothetical protein
MRMITHAGHMFFLIVWPRTHKRHRRSGRHTHCSFIGTFLEPTMADDLKQTGKPDDARSNVEQNHELGYWAEKLGVSREQLRKAMQAAGPMVKDVQRHLGR